MIADNIVVNGVVKTNSVTTANTVNTNTVNSVTSDEIKTLSGASSNIQDQIDTLSDDYDESIQQSVEFKSALAQAINTLSDDDAVELTSESNFSQFIEALSTISGTQYKGVLTSANDLNKLTEEGYYIYYSGNTPANCPDASDSIVEILNSGDSSGCEVQRVITMSAVAYERTGKTVSNTWSGWRTLLDTGNYKSICTPANIGAATSSHTHGLLHTDMGVLLANTTTDSGWSMINSTYKGYILKSVRTSASAPDWICGDYSSGICFGGADTKGIMSVAYNRPYIKFAGGNGTKPVWNIGLTGTSSNIYNLDNMFHDNVGYADYIDYTKVDPDGSGDNIYWFPVLHYKNVDVEHYSSTFPFQSIYGSANNQKITFDGDDWSLQEFAKKVIPIYGSSNITGNLEFANSGTGIRGVYGVMGDNDAWRVVGGATGTNAGYLEIATNDDGDEPIYVRQYGGNSNDWNKIKRTATLLDASGNTSFPGTLTASTIKGTTLYENGSSLSSKYASIDMDYVMYDTWYDGADTWYDENFYSRRNPSRVTNTDIRVKTGDLWWVSGRRRLESYKDGNVQSDGGRIWKFKITFPTVAYNKGYVLIVTLYIKNLGSVGYYSTAPFTICSIDQQCGYAYVTIRTESGYSSMYMEASEMYVTYIAVDMSEYLYI